MNVSVVIADGNDISRAGLKCILCNLSSIFVCEDVCNSCELIKSVKNYKPNIVLLDYNSKGFELNTILDIKNTNKNTRIIGITDSYNYKYVRSAIDKGIVSHIKKDCPKQEVLDSIIDTANNKRFFCTDILNSLKFKTFNTKKEEEKSNCSPITLSDRELEVVKLISEGYTNAQIAVVLHISNHTVNTHRKNIIRKLGVGNTAGIVMFAVKNKFVNPDTFKFNPPNNKTSK